MNIHTITTCNCLWSSRLVTADEFGRTSNIKGNNRHSKLGFYTSHSSSPKRQAVSLPQYCQWLLNIIVVLRADETSTDKAYLTKKAYIENKKYLLLSRVSQKFFVVANSTRWLLFRLYVLATMQQIPTGSASSHNSRGIRSTVSTSPTEEPFWHAHKSDNPSWRLFHSTKTFIH